MENNDDQRIIKYLNGQLTDTEKKAFEKEMATDWEFAAEVDFYRDINTVTNHISEKKLKDKISGVVGELEGEGFFNENKNENATRQLKITRLVLAIAASLLILAIAGFWYANNNYSDKALASKYFNAETTISTVRSETGTVNKYEEGLLLLEKKEYDKAIAFFKRLLTGNDLTDENKFEPAYYLALVYYQKDEFAKAANTSLPIATSSSRWQPKGRWLHLNALLSLGQTDEGFYNFLEAAREDDSDPFYQKQAVGLGDEMDSFWRRLAE